MRNLRQGQAGVEVREESIISICMWDFGMQILTVLANFARRVLFS